MSTVPRQLKYGSKVESAMAKSYRSNIAPQNGTGPYALGNTITVNIPTRNNLVLVSPESYLKFDFAATNGATANNPVRWDSCGAHGLIQRIRIWHGANLLEDQDNYGLQAKMLFDLQVPQDATYGKYNILAGTRNDLITVNSPTSLIATYPCDTAANILACINAKTVSSSSNQINSGASLGVLAGGAVSATQTYCLNLISLIGSLCGSNYLPLFAATSAPLRVEIQLVSSAVNCLASTTAIAGISLTNVEYVANFMELSDPAMSVINGSLDGQPLQFALQGYRNYGFTYALVNGTNTQVNMPIPAKFSSLKSIIVTTRDQQLGALTYFPFSSVTCGMTQYYFRIGPNILPSKAPTTIPEYFSEVMKAMGSMSDLAYTPSIELASYSLPASVAVDATGTTNSGSFYVGIDLENYPNASKDTMFAGYNSSTDDIYAVLNYTHNANITARLDAFALFDQVICFQNNTCFVKF